MSTVGINRHGLERPIPPEVKREVRTRCGFACARCAKPFGVTYHHFDPPFWNAKKHRPDRIVLLCSECHTGAHSYISGSEIARYSAAPKARSTGFARADLGDMFGAPVWRIGSNEAMSADLSFGDALVGRIEPPEADSGIYRLSLVLTDPDGGELLAIERNVVRFGINRFDITYRISDEDGWVVEIRSKRRDVILDLRIRTGEFVSVQTLRSMHGKTEISVLNGVANVRRHPAGPRRTSLASDNCDFSNLGNNIRDKSSHAGRT